MLTVHSFDEWKPFSFGSFFWYLNQWRLERLSIILAAKNSLCKNKITSDIFRGFSPIFLDVSSCTDGKIC